MQKYNIDREPLSVHGLAVKENGTYWRLPSGVIDTVNDGVSNHARETAGARVRFRSDSANLRITYRPLSTEYEGYIMSRAAKSMIGVYIDGRYAGATARSNSAHSTFTYSPRPGTKNARMESVDIYLPIENGIETLDIEIDDGAQILPPLPYKYPEQVVFYGSSITQGLAASHAGRTYVDQVCRALDTEYLNLGFSGSARGEDSIREYIASLPMSAFVLDYDHNAPSLDHLRATHEPLYRAVRKTHPDIPILIMNRPDFYDWLEDDHERRAIVRATYEKALAEGDERVWFIDGESFFGEGIARFDYTVDGCHPNDAGFDRMAAVVLPVLREMLESRAK